MAASRHVGLPARADTARTSRRLPEAPALAWPQGAYASWVKPVTDRLVAGLLLLLLLPLLLTVVLSVRLTQGAPVLFRQQRVGRGGTPFTALKLRTMRHDRRRRPGHAWDAADRRITHKSDQDPRHTRLGRLLRASSLDELPQLWNVVRGDMSLVGPRPELVDVVRRRYLPHEHQRHAVRPGLAGLWQISHRGDGLMHEHVAVDLRYVEHFGWRQDLRIALRTVPALVRRPGS